MITRRRFLDCAIGAACGGCALAAGAVVVPYLLAKAPPNSGGPVRAGALDSFPDGGAVSVPFHHGRAIVLRKGEHLAAFDPRCTHLGCLVHWEQKDRTFLCPCHAGRFDEEGRVLSGPPPAPLNRIPARLDGRVVVLGRAQ